VRESGGEEGKKNNRSWGARSPRKGRKNLIPRMKEMMFFKRRKNRGGWKQQDREKNGVEKKESGKRGGVNGML